MPQRGLRRTPGMGITLGCVLAVLDDVEIKATQLAATKVVHPVKHLVELIIVISLTQLFLNGTGTGTDPAIQRQQVFIRNPVFRWFKPGEIGQQEARGITDASVGITSAFKDFIRRRNLVAVIRRRHPQAQDVGTHIIHSLAGGNNVAQGLGHFSPLPVHGETVGQHRFIRRLTESADTGQQGRLKPATVLV